MTKYIIKKIIQLLIVMLLISFLSFAVIYFAPGDVSSMYISLEMTDVQKEAVISSLGMDKSMIEQYLSWLGQILKGNLGVSIANRTSVLTQFLDRLPATLLLMGTSFLLSIFASIPLGLWAAYKRGTFIDQFISGISYVGMAVPSFWLGMILIIIFTGQLRILPSSGMMTPGDGSLNDIVKHLIMPTVTLVVSNLAIYIRYVRSSAIGELSEEYVLTAKSKGSSNKNILFNHVMKNSLLPMITLIGMNLPSLVTGSFVIESVFGWPGIGTLAMTAIKMRDYPIIMAYVLFSGLLLIIGNFIADILYTVADPRIQKVGANNG